MSRSGYVDDCDDVLELGRWRGAVKSAINGKRGQAFLKEMLVALDAMPAPRLIDEKLFAADGEVCAIGSVGQARGIDMSGLDPDEPDGVAAAFGISAALAREIVYENDEGPSRETPEQRFARMREWLTSHIITEPREPRGPNKPRKPKQQRLL